MPNGDPAPKRELKTWQKIVLGVTWAAVTAKDYYDHFLIDSSVASQSSDGQQRKSIELYRSVNMEKDNSLILTPIKNRLDESFKKIGKYMIYMEYFVYSICLINIIFVIFFNEYMPSFFLEAPYFYQ